MKGRLNSTGVNVGQEGLRKLPSGLSHIEVLISIVLITIMLVPAMQALTPGILGAGIHRSELELRYQLRTRVADVLAQPFSALDAAALAVNDPTLATVFSDAPGTQNRLVVFLARYDGDNADGDGNPFSGADEGLLWLKVVATSTNLNMETLTSAYAE